MFFTSGRPTRSMRTLNLPRVNVSATTPTSVLLAEEARTVDLDDEAQDVLPVHEDRAVLGERELLGRDRLQRRGRVEDERIPTRSRERANPVALAARLVIDG